MKWFRKKKPMEFVLESHLPFGYFILCIMLCLLLIIVEVWKYLTLRSPSNNHVCLDFCLQILSNMFRYSSMSWSNFFFIRFILINYQITLDFKQNVFNYFHSVFTITKFFFYQLKPLANWIELEWKFDCTTFKVF